MPQPVDYQLVLRDLLDKRAKIDAAIATIQELLAPSGRPQQDAQQLPASSGGAFLVAPGMSTRQAAIAYLSWKGRPQGAAEIAHGLERAGFAHGSTNFANVVRSTLIRSPGDFRRHGKKWSLVAANA